MNFDRVLHIISCAFLLLSYNVGYPQATKIVDGDYTFYSSESTTIEEAKRVAIDRAKIQAIADAFGTKISQNATTAIINHKHHSETQFFMIGTSDIKGEWIETIGEPKFSVKYEASLLAINCKIRGKIREIIQPELELEANLLKNGLTSNYESSDFRDGDELFIRFKSSLNGNIMIFLIQNNVVYRLLPYNRSPHLEYPISAEKNYTFFSKSSCDDTNFIDEYELYAENQIDAACIMILYTPNSIGAAPITSGMYDEPFSMELEHFNKWLVKKRNKDVYSRVIVLPLTIKKI